MIGTVVKGISLRPVGHSRATPRVSVRALHGENPETPGGTYLALVGEFLEFDFKVY